jgi:transcription antitermination protein NusB
MTAAIRATPSIARSKSGVGRKSRRHCSRELALQGIYQWRVAGGTVDFIEAQLHDTDEFQKADGKYFSILLRHVLSNIEILEKQIQPCLDRPLKELSPIEYAILLISTCELANFPDIPYRAVINEAIELAKSYGGTEGYKYVNGVLDKLAVQLRAIETKPQIKPTV